MILESIVNLSRNINCSSFNDRVCVSFRNNYFGISLHFNKVWSLLVLLLASGLMFVSIWNYNDCIKERIFRQNFVKNLRAPYLRLLTLCPTLTLTDSHRAKCKGTKRMVTSFCNTNNFIIDFGYWDFICPFSSRWLISQDRDELFSI
jgi:hypothetical protein